MVIANIARKSGPFVADGTLATFPYDFRIFTASQLRVYQDMTLVNTALFSVTGVNGSSGSVVFNTAPAAGIIVWIFGNTDKEQPTLYPPSYPFPALSHETGLDRSIMVLWELDEQLERTLKFDQSALVVSRNIALTPFFGNALKFFQINATEDEVIYAPGTLQTGTPVPGVTALLTNQRIQAVAAVDNETQLFTSGLVPAGSQLTQLMVSVEIEPDDTRGLISWSLGTVSAFQRFGRGKTRTVGTVTNAGEVVNYVVEPAPSGLEAVITADAGGPFGPVGRFVVTAVYEFYAVPLVVP